MRQYWRDFESMERWARTGTHAWWWRNLLADPRGVGFWHETHFADGGTEALYVNMAKPTGLMSFAPVNEARKSMYTARRRLHLPDEATADPPVRGETSTQLAASRPAPALACRPSDSRLGPHERLMHGHRANDHSGK